MPATALVRWLGHATVLLELGGVRLLTDPVLRSRLLHMRRMAGPVNPDHHAALDAVLISHLHRDHLDVPSLRRLQRDSALLVVPAGTRQRGLRRGFRSVTELTPGEQVKIGGVVVTAVPAVHNGRRDPLSREVSPLGYVVDNGTTRVYFAGDTDLFEGMAELGELDLALLPVWGWGPTLGPGHLDPEAAARALTLLRPRAAVPIHWGTLFPRVINDRAGRLSDPPHEFREAAERLAPEVDVRVLLPGEAMEL